MKGKPLKVWLTKGDSGRYIITKLRPTIAFIQGTTTKDCYERVGEPMAKNSFCESGIVELLGHPLEPLTPTKIQIEIKVLPSNRNT